MARQGVDTTTAPTGHPPPEDGTTTTPPVVGGITDADIMAHFPGIPWSMFADGGKAVFKAFRDALAAGGSPAAVVNAAWAVIRSDTNVMNTFVPGYNNWATQTGTDTSGWESVSQFTNDKYQHSVNIDQIPQALRDLFTPDQQRILRGGNLWSDEGKDLFGFFGWAQENLHYWTDPNFTSFHGPATYATLHSAYEQNISGSALHEGWSITQQEQHNDASQAASEARSEANQAAAEARQEAERKARIEAAAQRIQAGYDPSISALFTPDELHNAAIWEAGGEWGDAKASREIALASPVNQYFQHFYGRAPTRGEIDQYYASGATPEYVNQTLDSLGIQRAFPTQLQTLFTPDEIKAYSDERAGIHTETGKHIADLVDAALNFNPIYQQYQNRPITRQELEGHVNAGDTAQKIAGTFGGQAFTQANQADIQYYQGAFGEGQLSPEQMTALGQNEAGYTTPLGASLQTKFEQAIARARTAFQGTVAHIERTNQFGQQQMPDLGA